MSASRLSMPVLTRFMSTLTDTGGRLRLRRIEGQGAVDALCGGVAHDGLERGVALERGARGVLQELEDITFGPGLARPPPGPGRAPRSHTQSVRQTSFLFDNRAAVGRRLNTTNGRLIGNRFWPSGALTRSLKPKACVSMGAEWTRWARKSNTGLAAYGPARTVKAGADALDQVRAEGKRPPSFLFRRLLWGEA